MLKRLVAIVLLAFLPWIIVYGKDDNGQKRLTAKDASNLFYNILLGTDEGNNYVEALNILAHTKGYKDKMPTYCARALLRYSWVLLRNGQTELAGRTLREAQKYITPADSAMLYDIKSGLGNCYMNSGQYEKAKKILLELIDYHKKKGMTDKYIADLQNLGVYYNNINQLGRAYDCLKKAQKVAIEHRSYIWVFSVNRNLADILTDSQQKINLMSSTLEMEMRQNLPQLMPQTHYYLSKALFSAQQYDRAIEEAGMALEGAHEISESVDSTDVLSLLAKIYTARQNFELATYYYRETCQRMQSKDKGKNNKIANESRIANDLIAWCNNNVVMKSNGDFELKSDEKTSVPSNITIIIVSLLVLCSLTLLLIILYQKRKANEMEHTIGYLLLFYNNQNVLLKKIYNLLKQVSGRDTDSTSKLRNISHFLMDNRLDNFQSEFASNQQKKTDEFIERLTRRYPNLTDTEKQTAVYLWHGLSTHEICVLTGNQPRSVNTNRYRLRKSMSLGSDEDLVKHLHSI